MSALTKEVELGAPDEPRGRATRAGSVAHAAYASTVNDLGPVARLFAAVDGQLARVTDTPWGAVVGAVPVFVTLTGWFWPRKRSAEERPPEEVKQKTKEHWLRLKEQES